MEDSMEFSVSDDQESSGRGAPLVEIETIGQQPIPEAVERACNLGIRASENADTANRRVTALLERIARLEERVERQQRALELLAAESDFIGGECTECGGALEVQRGIFRKRRIACTECGTVEALVN